MVLPKTKATPEQRRLVSDEFLVGKGTDCDLCLGGWFAPHRAAMIVRTGSQYLLINLSSSKNAIAVNGQPVATRQRLPAKAAVEVYGQVFKFVIEDDV